MEIVIYVFVIQYFNKSFQPMQCEEAFAAVLLRVRAFCGCEAVAVHSLQGSLLL